MGSCIQTSYIQAAASKMLKTVLAVCVIIAAVEGSYYGYGSGYGDYGYGGYGGYGGHGYGGYGDYGYGGYGGYGYGGYGYGGYPGYGYGYSSYPSYGYGSGYGYGSSKYKRSVGHGEQVHVSGATGQTVVTAPTHAGAPAHGSYYAPAHGSYYAPSHLSYAPHYPRYGYSDYYHYDPRVTATHAAYSHPRPSTTHSAYPVPAHRQGYSSHGYGNVFYPVTSAYLYSQVQGHGVYGEVDGHHYPYNYYPRHY